jgi:Fe-S cluster assembly protein SufB
MEISQARQEPEWLLQWRLDAFAHWQTLSPPRWGALQHPEIDFQSLSYFSDPTVDPEQQSHLLDTFEALGVPVHEREFLSGQRKIAVDAVMDSVSVATTFQRELAEMGILFCSFKEAVLHYPALVQQYLGSVVSTKDNFYAALNAAVFSDGSFCYIPKGVQCPYDLSTYFRIQQANVGQFERTLIIADEGSMVTYLEGCTSPARPNHQLHAAVVEIVAHAHARVYYSTVQNWFSGDQDNKGGIYNFVTKRGECRGDHSLISWTQVETGSAITWKYPSVILRGHHSVGEFYSVSVTNHSQQADTGTKMIHLGAHTKSRVLSKSIAQMQSRNTFRSLVRMGPNAAHAHSRTQCDSLLMDEHARTDTLPTHHHIGPLSATIEHEASTSCLQHDTLVYMQQRGFTEEEATSLLTNGFCSEVFAMLPIEFGTEANRLLDMKLEGSIG